MSWWINPVYDKSIYGLIKAIVWGEPGYAPSYLFLRNSVLSSLLFSVIFAWLAKKAGSYNIHIRRKQSYIPEEDFPRLRCRSPSNKQTPVATETFKQMHGTFHWNLYKFNAFICS